MTWRRRAPANNTLPKLPMPSVEHAPVDMYYNAAKNAPTLRCFCGWKTNGESWVAVAVKFEEHLSEEKKMLTPVEPCEPSSRDGSENHKSESGQAESEYASTTMENKGNANVLDSGMKPPP